MRHVVQSVVLAQVVHTAVYVRSKPDKSSAQLGVRRKGDGVSAQGCDGDWLELLPQEESPGGFTSIGGSSGSGAGGWMMRDGSSVGLGMLLKTCEARRALGLLYVEAMHTHRSAHPACAQT